MQWKSHWKKSGKVVQQSGSHRERVSGLKSLKYFPTDSFPVPLWPPIEQQRILSCLLQSLPECEPEPCLGFPLFPLSSLPPLSSHNLSQLRLQTVTQVGESSDTGLPDPPIASPTVYKIHFFSFRWSTYWLTFSFVENEIHNYTLNFQSWIIPLKTWLWFYSFEEDEEKEAFAKQLHICTRD